MANPRYKPVPYARQEALDALIDAVNEALERIEKQIEHLHNDVQMYGIATRSVAEDIEAMSDIMVSAGILTVADDDDAEVEEPADADEGREVAVAPESDETGYKSDSAPDATFEADEEPVIENEGAAEAETPAQRNARIEAARARRAAAVQAQGLKAFEEANESNDTPVDINDVVDIPEEGVTVGEGRDPITGESIR